MKNLIHLIDCAEETWLPNWFSLFSDKNGGFHERLNSAAEPLDIPKRLLTQCRQIIVYSQYIYKTRPENSVFFNKINEGFEFITDHYHNHQTGGCVFSLDKDKTIRDHQYDLYAHAFVILACAEYLNATKNPKALTFAKTTLDFIRNNFQMEYGYAETLDQNLNIIPAIRRQNPHMHLMEACLFMYEVSQDKDYMDMADQMLDLFSNKFFDSKTKTLGEFFTDNLRPHPTEGHKIEAGHHAEWIWLLEKYQNASGTTDPRLEQIKDSLFTWVKTHGIDKNFGGIYNTQDRQGEVIDENKRIWCLFETLRASAIMAQNSNHSDDALKIINQLSAVIEKHYIYPDTGHWNEILNRDLSVQTGLLPATTPYHIYPALKDTLSYLLNPHYSWENAGNKKAILFNRDYDTAYTNQDIESIKAFEIESLDGQDSYKPGVELEKDWGLNSVLDAKMADPPKALKGHEADTVTKSITIFPKKATSLQRHRGREETWEVKSGTLTVIRDGELLTIRSGEKIVIPVGSVHSMMNIHDENVVIRETQRGFCRESDNVRLLDIDERETIPFSNLNEVKSAMLYVELEQKLGGNNIKKANLLAPEYKQAIED